MNGLALLLIALPMAVLVIDTEKPGFVCTLEDILRGKGRTDGRIEISVDRPA